MNDDLETASGVIFMPLFPTELNVAKATASNHPTSPAKAPSRHEPTTAELWAKAFAQCQASGFSGAIFDIPRGYSA